MAEGLGGERIHCGLSSWEDLQVVKSQGSLNGRVRLELAEKRRAQGEWEQNAGTRMQGACAFALPNSPYCVRK